MRIVFGPSCQPSICRGALQPLVEMTVSGAPPQSEFASSILANCAENPCCRSIMFEGQVQRVVSRGALAAEGFLKIQQKMQQDSSALSVVKSPIRPHTREVEVEGGSSLRVSGCLLARLDFERSAHAMKSDPSLPLPFCLSPLNESVPRHGKSARSGLKIHHNVSRGPRLGRGNPRFPLGAPLDYRGEIDRSDRSGAVSRLGSGVNLQIGRFSRPQEVSESLAFGSSAG